MLALDRATLARGRRVLVEDLSLTLHPGEVLGLLGPNGAGKSTVLAGLCGDLVPTAGSATLDGRPLARWSRAELARRRAVLPQASRLAFSFRVREIAGMGVLPGSGAAPAALVDEALGRADVAHLAERDYATLSGGEQQRVQLARVLAQLWSGAGPRYLLLDEPTASLDLAHQLWRANWRATKASGCWRSCTTWGWPPAWPTAWRCSRMVGWWRPGRRPRCSTPRPSPRSSASPRGCCPIPTDRTGS
jgi:ABC-type hemin transport system ATPase subunit